MKQAEQSVLAASLRDGARELGLELSEAQFAQLLGYLSLLAKWNTVYNLTAVRDPQQMVIQHLLDSLAAVPAFTQARNVLDVGAGGGLPGMVLAIAFPALKVSMIDTVHKKTAFLTQVKAELGLSNVTVHTGRVEALQVTEKFDVITSRAFADLADFINWSKHLLDESGRFIALKGLATADELQRVPAQWEIEEVRPLSVPGMRAERHLVIVRKKSG